jgi:uncharacterized repeat protein (TIGR03833 family)
MQRPRNRQGRPPRQDNGSRGGRRGGRQSASNFSESVPSAQQVCAGAFVSIVLKIDQPTGHEVQGTVADVLTSGNHPRGIKVRLVDGRVGRVQRIATEEEARNGSAGSNNLGRNGEPANGQDMINSSLSGRPQVGNPMGTEDRNEPTSSYSLEAFLPPGHPLRDGPESRSTSALSPISGVSTTQTCPVCGEFEGDEIAVSHHVATHFD